MAKRQSNQLPNNLPQLQNLIKRDAESYKEEFAQQLRHFKSTLQVFELKPDEFNASLDELVLFLAQVAKCYQEDLADFPQTLVQLLHKHSTVLDPDMRISLCRALILLRNKNLLASADLHQLFFHLLRCQDKSLRSFLKDHIVNDIKNINAKGKDVKLNTTLQNFMYGMLKDSHTIAAKTSLDCMISLYQKGVWRDAKTVNVITTACFSKITKVMVTAIKFFLGNDQAEDDEKSDDEDDVPTVKEVTMANKFNKKTKKREKYLENIKKAHKKKKKKEKAPNYNFSALHLIHDPQSFAEQLFKRLEGLNERFEVKVMLLDLVSRLIGTHQLILLNYYSYIARFLAPHQREVVQLLQFSAQAAHELVPPETLEPVLKGIVNNFITERNSAEVMAVGLNAVRELCNRCPLVMTEDLLRDLVEYKTYKDKGVMMASKSLIQLFRNQNPELLHKRDRGRPTEAVVTMKAKQFGELDVAENVPGAEVIDVSMEESKETEKENDDEDGDDSEWENVSHPSDNEEEEAGDKFLTVEEKVAKASEVTLGRILTDEDFKRIDAAQLKKQVQGVRKGPKVTPQKGTKRSAADADLDTTAEEGTSGFGGRNELVNLDDIELIHKKRKHDKEARLASVMEGREDRGKFGGRKSKMDENASMTNKQKNKKKNFSMLKHKIKAKQTKKSFREKQQELKKRLLKQRKMK